MKIKQAIRAFELAKKAYKEAIEKNFSQELLMEKRLHFGICNYMIEIHNIWLYDIFHTRGHYRHSINKDTSYLFEPGKESLELRYQFLKKEIPYLKELLKKGYTYIYIN